MRVHVLLEQPEVLLALGCDGVHAGDDACGRADDEGGDDDAEEHNAHGVELLGRGGGRDGRLEAHRCRHRPEER